MLALDVARIEAGLLLIDVDFASSKKALIESQKYSPFEMGLGRLVALEKGRFVGQSALAEEKRRGPARTIVGLEIDWTAVETFYERLGLAPQVPATASRVPVPVYGGSGQVGKATSTHLVADAQEIHRAGHDRRRERGDGDGPRLRDNGRGGPAAGSGDRRRDAVLQSAEKDGDAAGMSGTGGRPARAGRPVLRRGAPLEEAWTIPAAWYVDPASTARARHGVLAELADGRPGRPGRRRPASTSPRTSRASRSSSCAASDGALRGVLQRLPPPRRRSCHDASRGQAHCLPLSVPRLDLLASRASSRHAGLQPASATSIARRTASCPSTVRGLGGLRLRAPRMPRAARSPSILGRRSSSRCVPLQLASLHFVERRRYSFDCNWKVFVDNYLDGGYHVPYLHKGLDSVLDYAEYTIENGERYCLQSSPVVAGARAATERRAQRRPGALLLAPPELHDQLVRGADGHEPRRCRSASTAPR